MEKRHGLALSVIAILISMVFLTGCGGGSSPGGTGTADVTSGTVLPSDRKGAILQMTTVCENDPHTTFQYNFANNNGDGCGITFGCIGFTTGTFSGNLLIHYYTTLNPGNILAKYIPALDRIDSEVRATGTKSNDTTGLDNFINDVQNCTDPLFKEAQRYEVDQMYWNPAVTMVANIGAKYPLTLAFIYDMCVNHGQDGAQRYINQTVAVMGGSPVTGVDERPWLARLISVRKASFSGVAADRCSAFQRILESGNLNLIAPFTFSVYGDPCTIDGNVY